VPKFCNAPGKDIVEPAKRHAPYHIYADGTRAGADTGVAASATYEWFVASRKSRALKNQFKPFEGEYAQYTRNPGSNPAGTGGTITLEYAGQTKFVVQGTTSAGKREWHGEIFMREEAGVIGTGFYSYDGKDDAGIHRVIYNPELDQFDVSGENTTHPQGAKDFKMVWKRIKPTK
jgi:hypothetical protein